MRCLLVDRGFYLYMVQILAYCLMWYFFPVVTLWLHIIGAILLVILLSYRDSIIIYMTQFLTIALIAIWFKYPYPWVSMLWFYVAYAKPDYLPIVAMVLLYLCYKWAIYPWKDLETKILLSISLMATLKYSRVRTEEMKSMVNLKRKSLT